MLLLVVAVFAAYAPAISAEYVRFDDTDYIAENPLLRTTTGLGRIWTRPQGYPPGVPYYPVTFTVHWMEYHLWNGAARGYHLVSIGLHAANSVLLWLLLRKLGVPGALCAGLLWALHPVHVQSVAWLAERKNVLAALFYFLAALAWLRFARRGSWAMYALALVMFFLGLLSKTVVCTFPAAVLLWIWWRRPQPVRRLVLLTIPLFALALALVLVAYWRENTMLEGKTLASGLSPIERLLIAGRGLWFYLGKLFVPFHLLPIYPHWTVDMRAVTAYAYPLAAAAMLVLAWLARGRIGRAPLVAGLFFVTSLAPTSGLMDFGFLAKSFVGDHYLYLPSIAVLAGVTALGARLAGARRAAGVGLAAAFALGLGLLTWRQGRVYHDAETFWNAVVASNPTPTALSSLGDVYLMQKDLPRAEELLRRALAGRDSARTRFRLGNVLIERRDYAAAAEQFERALALNRTRERIRGMNAPLLVNLGICRWQGGDLDGAADAFREAAQLDPGLAAAREWRAAAENALRNRTAPATSTAPQP